MSNTKKSETIWEKLDTLREEAQLQNKIVIPIYFYENKETGKKVYDLEEMTNEFESRLSLLTGASVMCSVKED
jgi:hypothetical protein